MRTLRPKAVLLGLASSTIGCDRVTKHVAAVALAGAPGRSFLADTLRLEYAENRSAFLSLGAGLPEDARIGLFTVGTGLLLAVLAWLALRRGWSRRDAAGLTLIWA